MIEAVQQRRNECQSRAPPSRDNELAFVTAMVLRTHYFVTIVHDIPGQQSPTETAGTVLKSALEGVPTEGTLGVHCCPEPMSVALTELKGQAERGF
jgi:hypothetical protein